MVKDRITVHHNGKNFGRIDSTKPLPSLIDRSFHSSLTIGNADDREEVFLLSEKPNNPFAKIPQVHHDDVLSFYEKVSFLQPTCLSIKPRTFIHTKKQHEMAGSNRPKLVVITGSPGTGKSTFGMSLALDQGIIKCVSTDTVRSVMRGYVPEQICPSLHRSSYAQSSSCDDPVAAWKETCTVLENSLEGLVDDAIERRTSLVLEGVSIVPSKTWISKWKSAGGVACGVLLVVTKEEAHMNLLAKRGLITGNRGIENKKIQSFNRIRQIQAEMIKLARENDWILIEQKIVDEDPLDVIAAHLNS